MPLSGSTNAKTADFVTFESAEKPDTVNYLVRKKLMFERRRKQKTSGGGSMDITMALNVRPNVDFQLVIDPMPGRRGARPRRGAAQPADQSPAQHLRNVRRLHDFGGQLPVVAGEHISKKFIIESGSMIPVDGRAGRCAAQHRCGISAESLPATPARGRHDHSSGTGGDDQSPDGGAAYAGNDYSRRCPSNVSSTSAAG